MKPTALSKLLCEVGNAQMAHRRRFAQLQNSWVQIVGEAVAAHSRPVRCAEGILLVAVSSAVWAQNLGYQRRLLITKLAATWPGGEPIRDIRFETTAWYAPERKPRQAMLILEHPARNDLKGKPPRESEATTLDHRLDRLRTLTRWRASQLPTCPRCQMAAPLGEIARWRMCGSCVLGRGRP